MNFIYEARSKEGMTTQYQELSVHGLMFSQTMMRGTGKAEAPWEYEIVIKNYNKSRWEGVIHLSMPVDCKTSKYYKH